MVKNMDVNKRLLKWKIQSHFESQGIPAIMYYVMVKHTSFKQNKTLVWYLSFQPTPAFVNTMKNTTYLYPCTILNYNTSDFIGYQWLWGFF